MTCNNTSARYSTANNSRINNRMMYVDVVEDGLTGVIPMRWVDGKVIIDPVYFVRTATITELKREQRK